MKNQTRKNLIDLTLYSTLALLLALLAIALTACGTLDKTGIYATKYKADAKVIYDADSTVHTSYLLIDQFLKFERDNRAALSATPQVKQYADTLRLQSPGWFQSAIALRDAYANNPSPGTRDALQTALAVLRQAVNEATKQLTIYSPIALPGVTFQGRAAVPLPPLPPSTNR